MVDHLFVSKLNLVEGGKNVTIAARFGGWENAGLEDVSMMSIVLIMGTKLDCCVVVIVFHGHKQYVIDSSVFAQRDKIFNFRDLLFYKTFVIFVQLRQSLELTLTMVHPNVSPLVRTTCSVLERAKDAWQSSHPVFPCR